MKRSEAIECSESPDTLHFLFLTSTFADLIPQDGLDKCQSLAQVRPQPQVGPGEGQQEERQRRQVDDQGRAEKDDRAEEEQAQETDLGGTGDPEA